jgi:hypothetical protein
VDWSWCLGVLFGAEKIHHCHWNSVHFLIEIEVNIIQNTLSSQLTWCPHSSSWWWSRWKWLATADRSNLQTLPCTLSQSPTKSLPYAWHCSDSVGDVADGFWQSPPNFRSQRMRRFWLKS